jgi:hypothetical protein
VITYKLLEYINTKITTTYIKSRDHDIERIGHILLVPIDQWFVPRYDKAHILNVKYFSRMAFVFGCGGKAIVIAFLVGRKNADSHGTLHGTSSIMI